MKPPLKLYKFVDSERIDIVENGLIRFTQPFALNDPFEFQLLFDDIFRDEDIEGILQPRFDLFESALRKEYKNLSVDQLKNGPSIDVVLAFLKENPSVLEHHMKNYEPTLRAMLKDFTPLAKERFSSMVQAEIGILSLSENFDNQLLWAHYANSHKGFGIEFDTSHAFFHRRRSSSDELYYLRKVRYGDRSSTGRKFADLDGDDVFASKGLEWEYEAEWRMLVPLADANRKVNINGDEIYLFSFPVEAISAIILGVKSSNALYERVRELIMRPDCTHVKIRKAALNNVNSKINIIDDFC